MQTESITNRPIVEDPDVLFEELKALCAEYMESTDLDTLTEAYHFATKMHGDQKRKSGEPYITHPLSVAKILAELRMDIETVVAGILHDTVEDTRASKEDVAKLFGQDVANLVDGVTKITQIEVKNLTDEQAATIRKMLVAMGEDIRVIVIKLADRLHNMRTIKSLPEDRRLFKARETLEIYAPIAHRLGISSVKWELEDLAFYWLEPSKYKQVERLVADSREDREAYLENVETQIKNELEKVHIDARIMGRPKHFYSIYQKMMKKGKGFSEIYDLIAVRLIVNDIKDCYAALGAIHSLWSPIPGRFKDYIAIPKHNMYRSLHTTVMGPAGRPLEVQIRTEEMHRASEYGVAAHWRYKEGGGKVSPRDIDAQLSWLREMIDWSDESDDSREFLKDLKIDLEESDIYVFTPDGDVKTLRAGATPVDFAYAVHTEVGNRCIGAKVNGKIVPLSHKLSTGDRVEIMTSKVANPSMDWLSFVKTPSARNKIRQHFSKISRDNDTIQGREKLLTEMRKNGYGLSNARTVKALRLVADDMGYSTPEAMFVQIAKGKENSETIAGRLLQILVERAKKEEEKKETPTAVSGASIDRLDMVTSVKRPKKHEAHSSNGIVVKGIDDVLVRLSHCCNPVPGDEIIGFVTRGRGVSVHRKDCPNAADLMRSPERIIPVEWEKTRPDAIYKVEVSINAIDRVGLLLDVSTVFGEMGINVTSCTTSTKQASIYNMMLGFEVTEPKMIDYVIDNLSKIEGVFEVTRALPSNKSKRKKRKQ